MKIGANPNKFITKMIREKSSTNAGSFKGLGCGHRIDLAIFHGCTQKLVFHQAGGI